MSGIFDMRRKGSGCEAASLLSEHGLLLRLRSGVACEICGRLYSRALSLEHHKKVHEGLTTCPRAFACDVCGRFYAHAVSLGLHKKVHEGLTTCALCGKVLNKVADLRAHLRQVHRLSKDDVKKIVPHRPLFCDVCGRKYFHVSSLALHKKVHEGLTTCVICGK
ncbi:zinc finger protein 234-like, partial [Pollicipes pollicipes]|uniref:zinc finger protein 234-like n=1 Tax=Pollicipes pollicipes TaxID=41117 RepID=UPI001884AB76